MAGRNIIAVRFVLILLALAGTIVLSSSVAPDASAETKTHLSMKKRVKIQTELCQDGGGEISVTSTTKTNGPFVTTTSMTTTCTGGTFGGETCVNTPKAFTCTTTFVAPTPGVTSGVPESPFADAERTPAPVEPVDANVPIGGGVLVEPEDVSTGPVKVVADSPAALEPAEVDPGM